MSEAMAKVLAKAAEGYVLREESDGRTLNALVTRGYLRQMTKGRYKITVAGKKALKAA